ncbi:uncharacterized protein JCM15063_002581 [Sporobolomyces koalae]|uniref:uncharacterized protein n=1 Tax=Sporobolomyces koalae TaxID=500713 RepID=UPI00316DF12A
MQYKNAPSTSFQSPIGPLHMAHPSEMTSFVIPLPSSSRIRQFFRSNPSSSSSEHASKRSKKDSLQVTYDQSSRDRKSTYTAAPAFELKRGSSLPQSPPPSYLQAIEEDLYCEDIVDETAERSNFAPGSKVQQVKRKQVIEADHKMSEALKSFGI